MNELKHLGKRGTDDRDLPESPDQRLARVIRRKMEVARGNAEEDAGSPVVTRRMIEESVKEMTLDIGRRDLEMLRRNHPDVLELLTKLSEGSESAPWREVDQTTEIKDSVQAREKGKKRKMLERKAGGQ